VAPYQRPFESLNQYSLYPIPGSVLSPILFELYINDFPDAVESEAYLFADDTKIVRVINSLDDQHILQNDLAKLENWSKSCIQLKIGLVMP
jgi:hypothetical protein